MIVIPRQRSDRHEAIGTCLVETDKQPKARHTADAAGESAANAIHEIRRCEPAQSIPLCRGGPTLGRGYLLTYLDKRLFGSLGKPPSQASWCGSVPDGPISRRSVEWVT